MCIVQNFLFRQTKRTCLQVTVQPAERLSHTVRKRHAENRRPESLPWLIQGAGFLSLLHIPGQQISAPDGISRSGTIRLSVPSASSAHSSMPSDSTPASFAGFRFTRTITFLPTISSAV